MTSLRLLLILTILTLPQLIFAQGSFPENPTALYSDINLIQTASASYFSCNQNRLFSIKSTDTISFKNSLQNQVVRPQWIRGAIVPAGLILAGTITLLPEPYCLLSKFTIQEKELDLFPGVDTPVDNYLQFAPIVAVFGLKAAGVRSRSDFVNQMVITTKAELLMGVIVHVMKHTIRDERPSGIGMNTMPSGHTAQAFVAATILDMEYRDTSPWISVGGYAVATTTAIGRMVNNKHWISDVLIGAGIGIFSAKVVYYTHQYRWGKKNNIVILPAIYKNGGGVSFAMSL